ncbi:O-antigen ligase family protein [Candidatus Nomurabacteria bacterium]|nr:O-antigen ligase family protein [Candidatus Nomurabacteria bacterium]
MNLIIKRIILITIFLLPFIIFPRALYGMVFSKSLFLEGATLLIGTLWLIGKLYKKNLGIVPRNIVFLIFGIYTLILLISTFNGVLPILSFWGSVDHGLGAVFILCLIIFSIITSSVFKKIEDWHKLFVVFSISGILFTIGTFLSAMGVHFSKVIDINVYSGFLIGNSSWTGVYLTFVLFIGLGLAFSAQTKTQKVIGTFAVITAFFNPVLTGFIIQAPDAPLGYIGLAKTASYSMLVSTGIIALYLIFRKIQSAKIRKVFMGSVVSVILVGVISFAFIGLGPIKTLIAEKAGPNRLVFWEIAVKGYKDKPVLGWGGDTYQYVYAKYFNPIITTEGYAKEYWVDRSHNYYFDEIVTGGILGLASLVLLYGVIMFGLIRKAVRDRGKEGLLHIALFAGMVSFLIQGLMIFQTITGWFIVALIAAYVANICFKDKRKNKLEEDTKKNSKQKNATEDIGSNIFITIFILIIFGILYNYLIIKPYRIDSGLAKFPEWHYQEKIDFYKKLDKAYFGNLTDLGNVFNPYHIKLRKVLKNGISQDKKEMMIKEINNINVVLENGLKRQNYMDMKLLVSTVGMHSILIALTDTKEREEYFKKGMFYVEKMGIASPENPIKEMSAHILEFPLEYGEEGLDVLDVSDVKVNR